MSRYHKYCLFLVWLGLCLVPLSADDVRDKWHQPEKVMDLVGVRPGMIIGEVGAGHGYFTFKLSQRVGESGKIYANDISRSALRYLRDRCDRERITNIETFIGEVEDPLAPVLRPGFPLPDAGSSPAPGSTGQPPHSTTDRVTKLRTRQARLIYASVGGHPALSGRELPSFPSLRLYYRRASP